MSDQPADDAAMSPARRRAEARKAKILSQGGDRLAKITGAMKAGSGASEDIYDATPVVGKTAGPGEDDDPAETVPTATSSSVRNRRQPPQAQQGATRPRASSRGFGDLTPPSYADRISGEGAALPPPGGAGAGEEDPLQAMMRMMGMPVPPGGAAGEGGGMPPGMEGMAKHPFFQAMMQQQQQAADGNVPGAPPPGTRTWVDRIFPLLHLVAVLGLVVAAVGWWEPMGRYGGERGEVNVQGWAALSGKGKGVGYAAWEAVGLGGLAQVPVFWMFVTAELGLQAGRLLLSRWGPPPPAGLLSTLITFLPPPYSTLVSTLLKYYSLLDSFLDDLFLLVFALGWLVVWGEWRSGRAGPEGLALPREGE